MNTELLTRGFNAIRCLLPPVKSGVNIHIGNMNYDDFVVRIPQIIHDINDGAKRIEHIVSDLKDYTRPPSAANAKFDLNSAASTAAHLNKSLLKKYTKSFHLHLCNESAVVHGDKQKIEQAITNLLQNSALALTNSNQKITMTTGVNKIHRKAFVEIKDEGRGIEPQDVKHLANPFFTTRRAEGGTGLGLWIVYHIVQYHNGDLSFSSQPGKGTTARIELDLKEYTDVLS